MLSHLQLALQPADPILARTDQAISRLQGDGSEDAGRTLARIRGLLAGVVVGRTLNMGFLTYVRAVIGAWDSLSPGEPEVMVDQIRANMRALVELIDLIGPPAGADEGVADIRRIAQGEDDLVNQVRTAREAGDPKEVDRVAIAYESFCSGLRARARALARATGG